MAVGRDKVDKMITQLARIEASQDAILQRMEEDHRALFGNGQPGLIKEVGRIKETQDAAGRRLEEACDEVFGTQTSTGIKTDVDRLKQAQAKQAENHRFWMWVVSVAMAAWSVVVTEFLRVWHS